MSYTPLMLAIVIAMTGCTASGTMTRDNAAHEENSARDIQRSLSSFSTNDPARVHGALVSDLPFVDPTPIANTPTLPAAFSRQVSISEPAGLPIQRMMQRLGELAPLDGFRLTYDFDIVDGESDGAGAARAPVAMNMPNPQQSLIVDSTLSALAASTPGNTISSASSVQIGGIPSLDTATRIALVYSGDVAGLLDQVAAGLGASWEYRPSEQRIHFARYVVETFAISMVPGSVTASAGVGGGGGGGGQGGQGAIQSSATAESKTTFNTDAWQAIEAGVQQLLSPSGTLTVSQPTASITVRDRADRIAEVRSYIENANESLTKQVTVEVRVLRVQNSKGDQRGFSLDMLVNQFSLNPNYRFQLFTPRQTNSDLASGLFTIPSRTPGGGINRYGGSSVAIDSLSEALNVTQDTRQTVITTNNMPAPVRIVQRTNYLASAAPLVGVGGTIGGGAVSAGANLTPGIVETGLILQIVPSVQPDGQRMYLQVLLSLSTLDRLRTIVSGGQSIEAPDVSSREFLQRVWMNSGETLVLAGFERYDTGINRTGYLDSALWPLGGKRDRNSDRESIVITITPVVSPGANGI